MNLCHVCASPAINADAALCLTCSAAEVIAAFMDVYGVPSLERRFAA